MHSSCFFRNITGLYCPGCGGQRAARALFVFGDVWRSFLIHPFVLYACLLIVLFAGSFIVHFVSGRKIALLRFRPAYAWIGLAIVVINWIIKNIFLLNGVDILKILTPVEYIV